MLYISLPLKLRVSGQKGRKLLWKEEIWHPTRETDKSKYHWGRQHNYPYRSPRPEAKTRGNKLLQRGWYPVRYNESQQKILARLWFIYGDPQHFKKKLPKSQKLLQSTQKSGTDIPRCLIYKRNFIVKASLFKAHEGTVSESYLYIFECSVFICAWNEACHICHLIWRNLMIQVFLMFVVLIELVCRLSGRWHFRRLN